MKGTSKSHQDRFFILLIAILFIVALSNEPTGIANKDENQPVLDVDMITDTSVLLNWDLETCDLDCNTYYLVNFKSWELYQKDYLDPNYFLAFATSDVWVYSTTVTGLEANSHYIFYIKLYWDWSNLHPDIAPTYGKNYTSDPVFVQTLSPGETVVLTNHDSDNKMSTDVVISTKSSLGVSLSLFPSIISFLAVVPMVSFLLVVLKRRMTK